MFHMTIYLLIVVTGLLDRAIKFAAMLFCSIHYVFISIRNHWIGDIIELLYLAHYTNKVRSVNNHKHSFKSSNNKIVKQWSG